MKSLIVNSASRVLEAQAAIKESFEKHFWVKMTLTEGKRSLDSNALSHVFYETIGKALGQTPIEAKMEAKLNYGVPILRRDEKCNGFFTAIGFDSWGYTKQLAAMKYVQVTSLFDPEQMREYLDTLIREYAKHGVILESEK